ncbi:glycosyltransferase [Kibdelosporangium lantanae]
MGAVRAVIMAAGTAGDIYPYTDVAERLRTAGHDVVFAVEESFRPVLEKVGFTVTPIPFGVQEWMTGGGRNHPGTPTFREYGDLARQTGEAMVRAYDRMVAAMAGADVLLLSYAVAAQGYLIAKAARIPSMGMFVVPMTPTREFPPAMPGLAGRSFGAFGNRIAGQLMVRVSSPMASWVKVFQRRLGLPLSSLADVEREMRLSGWPVRYGISTAVVPRPADWPASVDVVGYWWPLPGLGWDPSDELVDFLAAGPPPVLVTLGSMGGSEAGRLSGVFRDALRRAGLRGVIQSGVAGPGGGTDNDVLMTGNVSYDWLMPRVSAVVHHAGAGTLAATLRAGLPCVSVPVAFDNRFWARRAFELGVSPRYSSLKDLDVARLAGSISRAVGDAGLRDRAAGIARLIAREDGADRMAREVERIASSRPVRRDTH